jgi:hypothetical protein
MGTPLAVWPVTAIKLSPDMIKIVHERHEKHEKIKRSRLAGANSASFRKAYNVILISCLSCFSWTIILNLMAVRLAGGQMLCRIAA